MSKRIVIILLCAAISAGLFAAARHADYQVKYREQYDAAARALRIERSEIEKELSDVDQMLNRTVIGKGCGVFVFEELNEELYTDVLPVMKEHGYIGVLALSPESYPGAEDCITLEQFDYLLSRGWTTCVYWREQRTLERFLEDMDEILTELDMDMPQTIDVEHGNYQQFKDKELSDAGFTTVIHHGEAMDVIARSDDEKLFHLGAVGWRSPNVRDLIDETIEYGGSLALSMDFSSKTAQYEEENFSAMCSYLQEQEEKLYFADSKGARENVSMAENINYYSARKEFLEGELKRYDEEIKEIYKLDLEKLKEQNQ